MLAGAAFAGPFGAAVNALPDGVVPQDPVYWLADGGLVAVGMDAADGSAALWHRDADRDTADEIMQLDGPSHCQEVGGAILVRAGGLVAWSPDGGAVPADEDRAHACRAASGIIVAQEAARLPGLFTAIDLGQARAGVAANDMASPARLLLWSEQRIIAEQALPGVTGQDTVVLGRLASGDGVLVYPSYTGQRKAALEAQGQPGIPVVIAHEDGTITRRMVPWAEWNRDGLYRFALTRDGLVAAAMTGTGAAREDSGLYSEAAGWAQGLAADVSPGSLVAAPDGCRIAWAAKPFDAPAGSFRMLKIAGLCRQN